MMDKLKAQSKSDVVLMCTFIVLFLVILFFNTINFITKIGLLSEMVLLLLWAIGISHYGWKQSFDLSFSSKKRKCLLFLIVLVILAFSVLYLFAKTEFENILSVYYMTLCILLTGVSVTYFYYFVWNKKIVSSFGTLAFTIGTCFMLTIPVGVIPDEAMHSYTAYRLSNLYLGVSGDGEETTIMRKSDGDKYLVSYFSYYTDEEYNAYFDEINYGVVDDTLESYSTDTAPYVGNTDYLYILPSIGITIGRLLSLNTLQTFFLGRIFNFVLYLVGMMYAIKIMPMKKMVFALVGLLPVFIQQGVSSSYDVPLNVMMLLNIAYAIKLLSHNDKKLEKYDYVLLAINVFCLIMAKSHAYVLIGILPFLCLLVEKLSNCKYKKIIVISAICIVLIGIVGMFLWVNQQSTVILSESDHYTILYLLQNPTEIFTIVYLTLINQGAYLLESFVGKYLGYLDIEMPTLEIYLFYVLLLIVSIPREKERGLIEASTKVTFLIVAILTFVMIMAGMLLANSILADRMVVGAQGRYLLPIIVMLMLCVEPSFIQLKEDSDTAVFGLFLLLECISVGCLLMAL